MGLPYPPVYINKGEESELTVESYKRCPTRQRLCRLLYFFTLGFVRLIFHWKPNWHVFFTCTNCSLKEANILLIR